MAKLSTYKEKRDFARTSEPSGEAAETGGATLREGKGGRLRFLVQRHWATREHYDLRLEWNGVLLSWAVPKGPSYNPRDKRLAVHVEDHPLEYRDFEGTIPKGEYGGGTVMLWDEGFWEPLGGKDAEAALRDGELKFELFGQRLRGAWVLVRLKPKPGERGDDWLLIKERDDFARPEAGVAGFDASVRTGRTREEIEHDEATGASGRGAKGPGARNPFDQVSVELAKLADRPPAGSGWLYEVKYDGYRIVAFVEEGATRLVTRNGIDYTARFPALAEALAGMAAGRALVLDGELVVTDAEGRSDFQALQSFLRKPDGKRPLYMAFDLLALDGSDLRERPLVERKRLLEGLLRKAPDGVRFSAHVEDRGAESFRAACEMDLEGVVGKRADSPYRGTRAGDWIKLKCDDRQEFVVGGYTRTAKARAGVSALLLGAYEGDRLTYTGRVGSGIDADDSHELLERFHGLERSTPPFADPPRARSGEHLTWLAPELVAEVRFAEWTEDGQLRHPSYLGLRTDKASRDVVREDAHDIGRAHRAPSPAGAAPASAPAGSAAPAGASAPAGAPAPHDLMRKEKRMASATSSASVSARTAEAPSTAPGTSPKAPSIAPEDSPGSAPKAAHAAAGAGDLVVDGVRITNPGKLLFTDPAITKADVVRYYARAAEAMLPFAGARILSIVRCPRGAGKACFFKKHPGPSHPGVIAVSVPANDGEPEEYFYVRDAAGIVSETQMDTLEFHVWGSRVDTLEQPDMMVFDLDPDEGLGLDKVRRGVRDLKSLLDELSLASFLKTSGGKGYHVVVPFEPAASWKAFHDFARRIAEAMEERWPSRYTSNIRKAKRVGRIFIDWQRNGRGATSIAPYSLRARAGARVSLPIGWDELDEVAPDAIAMNEALARIESGEDPWRDFFKVDQALN